MGKRLPAVRETRVQSLGREDPLEEEVATHSSILAWKIPMDRKGWSGYSPWGQGILKEGKDEARGGQVQIQQDREHQLVD